VHLTHLLPQLHLLANSALLVSACKTENYTFHCRSSLAHLILMLTSLLYARHRKEKKLEYQQFVAELDLLGFASRNEAISYDSKISSIVGMCKNQGLCWHFEVIMKL